MLTYIKFYHGMSMVRFISDDIWNESIRSPEMGEQTPVTIIRFFLFYLLVLLVYTGIFGQSRNIHYPNIYRNIHYPNIY